MKRVCPARSREREGPALGVIPFAAANDLGLASTGPSRCPAPLLVQMPPPASLLGALLVSQGKAARDVQGCSQQQIRTNNMDSWRAGGWEAPGRPVSMQHDIHPTGRRFQSCGQICTMSATTEASGFPLFHMVDLSVESGWNGCLGSYVVMKLPSVSFSRSHEEG